MNNDLTRDLVRAKELLAKGKSCPYYSPDHNTECTHCDEWAAEHGELTEKEQWAVYQLLASFTHDLEQFLGLFSDYEEPCESVEQAEAIWNQMKARENGLHDALREARAENAQLGVETVRVGTLNGMAEDLIRQNNVLIDTLRAENAALRDENDALRLESDAAGRGWAECIELNKRLLTESAEERTETQRLRAEHTRAVLHYTAKGYAAGENADAKHWRERAEKAEAEHAQYVEDSTKTIDELQDEIERLSRR